MTNLARGENRFHLGGVSRGPRLFRPGAVLIAVLAAGLVLAASDASPKQPKISFKEDSRDFGKIKQGDEVSYDFVFRNDGDDVLNIKNVETSCGCTAALVSDRKVDPGKSGRIKVTFNSRGYSGEVTKYVFVDTDDPQSSRVQLRVLAAVDVPPQPRIDLDRFSYDAGLLVEGDELSAKTVVRNRGELELRFECVLQNASFFVDGKPARFPARVAAGKDAELEIRMPIANRTGMVREFALFKSNDPLRSTISLNLNGYVVTRDQLKKVFEKYKNILK